MTSGHGHTTLQDLLLLTSEETFGSYLEVALSWLPRDRQGNN